MWWFIAASAASQLLSSASQSSQQQQIAQSQSAYAQYNSQQQYNVSMTNIMSSLAIAKANASAASAVGNIQATSALATAKFNAGMIQETSEYNNTLLDEELSLMWESAELDLHQLEKQRARERGDILASQSASGTVMGVGSNMDVIIDQRTQEELDALIIKHGADIQAAKFENAKARNSWEAEMQTRKIMYEGEISAWASRASAGAQAGAALKGAKISALGQLISAGYSYESGNYQADNILASGNASARNTMNQGFFSAMNTGIRGYYSQQASTLPNQNSSLLTS